MIKLAIFGKSSFLRWSEGFETKMLSGSNPDQSLFGKANYHLQQNRRIKNLAKWSDVPYCEFLSEIAIKASHLSSKPVILRIHRAELDRPDRFERMSWDNVALIIADSKHYASLIRERVPNNVKIIDIPPGVEQEPVRRKRIYSLMLALAGHHTLYLAGVSASDRINRAANERWKLGHILEPDAEFPQWQSDKEFYVHHALDEGLSVAIQESMLAGLIPVVHRIPMALELVSHDLTYVYNHELVDLLHHLKDENEDERDALKEKHRKYAEDNLTNNVVHIRKKAVFEEYISNQ
ncbi:MAG: glycosyltransferase [Candidatus Thorarchaeota archaeon]|jgi:glycosyltransferase involved in cell wall biosynthesis